VNLIYRGEVRKTANGILSEPVGEKFLTMLEKPKEERVGEAELPNEVD